MKVSKSWLKELVDLKVSEEKLLNLLPLRTIDINQNTPEYFELDMKGYNRADLLSLRGIAYEVAAITNSKVTFKELSESEYIWANKNLPKTPVDIVEDLCSLQAVAKIEGLKVGPSPKEWVEKLEASGMRSVNNIADITNLVMLEYGHPLHAFNAKTVKDDTINIRAARSGEEIVTLDGKLRKLEDQDIVLADEEKALDVAGVMGGKDTEVTDSTTAILLSASLFNPSLIRKTANRLKLQSEASKRFYHGLTRTRLLQALDGAIRMYQEIGGRLTALTITGDTKDQLKKVPLTLSKTKSLIGVDLEEKQVEEYLDRLKFILVQDDNTAGWVINPPYWRLDIDIEEDLVEEVARMYGYEKIPAKPLEGELPEKIDQSLFEQIQKLKQTLVDIGLTEVQTYSFHSTKVLEALALPAGRQGLDESNSKVLVKIANPISSETEYMRMNIWPNLVEVIAKNAKLGYGDIGIFEIGKEYMTIPNELPKETYTLAIALMNNSDNPLAEVNQILKEMSRKLNQNLETKSDNPPDVLKHLFHPNRFFSIYEGETKVGGMAEIHPRVLNKLGLEKRIAVLQMSLE